MKVATVFMATAGVGAFAFTPVAALANQSKRVSGTIQQDDLCTNGHWVHISAAVGLLNSRSTVCYGSKGTYDVSKGMGDPQKLYYECGGTNYGKIDPKNTPGYPAVSFKPGSTYRNSHGNLWNSIKISGWSGNDTCPHFGPA